MKTFMEEYGLIIVAILVVAALIALAVVFNQKSSTNVNNAFDSFTTNANQAIEDAQGGSGSSSTDTTQADTNNQ